MTAYQDDIEAIRALKEQHGSSWNAIDPESVARMRAQNRFRTGLEIAQYTADIMRRDMAEYDADSSVYTLSASDIADLLSDPDVAPTNTAWLAVPTTLSTTP